MPSGLRDRNFVRCETNASHRSLHAHTALLEKKTQCTHIWNQRNPLFDNNDQAQSSCTDLRVQGELDQSTDDEERKRSLMKSQTMEVLHFPGMEYIHERHTLSSSSSWSRLYGAFTIYQESTPEVCETVIPSDLKVDRGSEINQWSDHD